MLQTKGALLNCSKGLDLMIAYQDHGIIYCVKFKLLASLFLSPKTLAANQAVSTFSTFHQKFP